MLFGTLPKSIDFLIKMLTKTLTSRAWAGFPWFSFSLTNSGNFFGTKLIFYIGTYGLSYISILIFLFPYIFIINNPRSKKNLIIFNFILLFILSLLFIDRTIKNHNTIKNNDHTISLVQMNFPINPS